MHQMTQTLFCIKYSYTKNTILGFYREKIYNIMITFLNVFFNEYLQQNDFQHLMNRVFFKQMLIGRAKNMFFNKKFLLNITKIVI